MELAEFERVYDSFCAFHAEFAPDFGRKQWRENSDDYLQGLLVQTEERRNAENMAEVLPISARALQRFLTDARNATARCRPQSRRCNTRVAARVVRTQPARLAPMAAPAPRLRSLATYKDGIGAARSTNSSTRCPALVTAAAQPALTGINRPGEPVSTMSPAFNRSAAGASEDTSQCT